MTGLERRTQILSMLKEAQEPLSASSLAKKLSVSRQIIVGDVALLRAEGEEIFASPKGYILPSSNEEKYVHRIACCHTNEQTAEELNILVDCGCKIIDVIVEHPVYGQLTGQLRISSRMDVSDFIQRCQDENAHSLCELTDGVHIHTIECPSEEALHKAIEALRKKGMILEA